MFPIKTTVHDDGTIVTLYEGAPCDDASFCLEAQGPADGVLKPLFDPIIEMMSKEKEDGEA